MTTKSTAPVLTDAKSLGGLVANDGFDYQLWDGLARLPGWLANPAFEFLIFEGLEDLEARFFAPHAPRLHFLERYQAKGGNITPAIVKEVLSSFQDFEKAYPKVARVQTLVTPRMPATLSWLSRDPDRVRHSRPFYAPFNEVVATSDAALLRSAEDEFGDHLGRFVANSIQFDEKNYPTRDNAFQAFAASLDKQFPDLEAVTRKVSDAFDSLVGLVRSSLGKPLTRELLVLTIEKSIGKQLPLPSSYPLRIASNRSEPDDRHLHIDASSFSGDGGAGFPDPARWQSELIVPLAATAKKLKASGTSRVRLSGTYRLSTALTVGWSLRSAIGFELEIPTKEGYWATDDRPTSEDAQLSPQISQATELVGERLAVSVGIIRNPMADLTEKGLIPASAITSILLSEPIVSARVAQAVVSRIKGAVDTAVARLCPKAIDLYFAGPAALGVSLGHRWNALPPTALHEFIVGTREYVQTATLA